MDRGRSFVKIWCFNLSFNPLLTETMDDSGQVLTKHLAQLPLNFSLNIFLNDSDRVERAIDIDVLQRVRFEDKGDSLLFRDHKHDVRTEAKVGKTQEHGYNKWFFCSEHAV